MGELDVINILDGLDRLFKKISWMDGLNVINILDGLDRCPLNGMDWMLDGLLTTLKRYSSRAMLSGKRRSARSLMQRAVEGEQRRVKASEGEIWSHMIVICFFINIEPPLLSSCITLHFLFQIQDSQGPLQLHYVSELPCTGNPQREAESAFQY